MGFVLEPFADTCIRYRTCHRQEVTENRGSENIWLKIRARPKLTTRIFGHLWPVTSTENVSYSPLAIPRGLIDYHKLDVN